MALSSSFFPFALQLRRERQKSYVLCALDGNRQPALMARASAGHSPRENLAALLHEGLENLRLLVIDQVDLIDAEAADLLFADVIAFSPARSWRSAACWATACARRSPARMR